MKRGGSLFLLLSLAMSCMAQVQPTFFGMQINKVDTPKITVPIGSQRLWDTGTNWFQVCPTSNYSNCNWNRLDRFLAMAKNNGVVDVLYTMGKTPKWISPGGDCGRSQEGTCYPPLDLKPDGGGTDEAWKGFVKAIVNHNEHLDHNKYAKIKAWGIWNEPNNGTFWKGTFAQQVRLTKDAREIIKAADPDALILTPEAGEGSNHPGAAVSWLDGYLNAGGGKYVDVLAFHDGTVATPGGGRPRVEDIVKLVGNFKTMFARHSDVAGKPQWNTETDYGSPDASWQGWDTEEAYVLRHIVLLAWLGMERVYWYSWDEEPHGCCGTMWSPQTGELPQAAAYREVHKWLLGRTVSNCASRDHIWTCDLEGPGYKGKIVWTEEYDKTAKYDATGFASYRDHHDAVSPLERKSAVITITNKPVLLETGNN